MVRQVEAVISELGLGKSRDTLVGDARVRGVSGGERKRVSVGCVRHTALSLDTLSQSIYYQMYLMLERAL
jgi:hypothetical protein